VSDQAVLLVTNILLGLVLNLALLFVAREYPATLRKSQRVWAGAGLCMVLAWLLLGLRAMGANVLSVIAANAVLGFGLAEYARALQQFSGRKAELRRSVVSSLIFAVITALLYYFEINRDLRAAVINVLAIAMLGYVFIETRRTLEFSPVATKLTMTAVAAFVLVLLLRSSYLVANMTAIPALLVQQTVAQQLISAGLTACFALLTFAFSIMCKERLTNELHRLVRYDSLTGTLNRAPWRTEFNSHFERGRQFSVLLFDIDHFKSVNDAYGHSAGDAVLQSIAACARVSFGERVGRLGGEEFAVIVPAMSESRALELGERFRRAVSNLKIAHGTETLNTTISLGVADATSFENTKDLLKAADDAMYAAKRKGRNVSVAASSLLAA
jgi:diguanylate cyclase (GGDEF)-like protein